jgi:uncharacterized protein YcbK (DUF882 family)
VHVAKARLKVGRLFAARTGYSCGLALLLFLFGSRALQNAVAEGETRTITMHHIHTGEDITITYKRDGRYDDAALKKLDWFLRDWRRGEATAMDPRLIDLVWEVQRESGSKEPIQVVCGYRSPATNAMLRRRSEGVARYSQHILGRAMDFYVPGVSLEQVREIGLRLARGGVGFYPESGSPFVHMDVADIRMWPRMSRAELIRVFPDGRTVQIPTDGKPLPGYAVALAEVTQRGATPSANSLQAARNAGINVDTVLAGNERPARANPFAKLLGLAKGNAEQEADAVLTPVAWHPQAGAPDRLDSQPEKKPALASAVKTKVARAIAKLKLVHVAKLLPVPAAPGTTHESPAPPLGPIAAPTAPTPNQIILARGYWEGPPDGMAVANPLAEIAYRRSVATEAAEADHDSTGAIDHGNGSGVALAYADSRDEVADGAAAGIAALRAAALAARQEIPAKTTIAVKRAADQVASAIMTASASSMIVIKSGVHIADPWLRAVMLSPSVRRFLTTVALGDRDFRSLAALMVKPKNAVKMTFAADPNPGLSQDRFSGAAIAFLPMDNYAKQTHTASLQ